MKITFVLNSIGTNPIGGYKVVYEYANFLVKIGHYVNVLHPASCSDSLNMVSGIKKRLLDDKSWRPDSWFVLDDKVNAKWIPSLHERYIPKADVIFACPVETSFFVANYANNKGKKFYLIQAFEDWTLGKNKLFESYKLPLKKIAISRWLQEKVENCGEEAALLPNGLDHDLYFLTSPISKRENSITFLYHTLDWKGVDHILEALPTIKSEFPNLKINSFGVDKPTNLPDFVNYYYNPEQSQIRELLNQTKIFLTASYMEGWGLPACEDMQCGCAVIAADAAGHKEFAFQSKTAELFEAKNITALITAVKKVLNNENYSQKIAEGSNKFIKNFTCPEVAMNC